MCQNNTVAIPRDDPNEKNVFMLKKSNRENYHSRKNEDEKIQRRHNPFHTNAPFYLNAFQCSSLIIYQVFCSSVNWHIQKPCQTLRCFVFCENIVTRNYIVWKLACNHCLCYCKTFHQCQTPKSAQTFFYRSAVHYLCHLKSNNTVS